MTSEIITKDPQPEWTPAALPETPTQAVTLFGTDDPAVVVERAQAASRALMGVVRSARLAVPIRQQEYLLVEAWELLGSMVGVFPSTVWTRPIKQGDRTLGWEARVEARTLSGAIVGAAEAMCLREESRWSEADEHAIRSMSQTRATSKALSMPLRFIAKLAGFAGTPAEEMHGVGTDEEAEAVRLFDALKGDHDQQRWAIVKRFGWSKAKGGAVSKWLRELADDRQAAIVIAFKQLTMDDSGPPLGGEPRAEGGEARDRAAQRFGVHQSATARRGSEPLDETREELMRVINAMPMNRRATFLGEHGYKGQALKTWLGSLDDMQAGELLAASRVTQEAPA